MNYVFAALGLRVIHCCPCESLRFSPPPLSLSLSLVRGRAVSGGSHTLLEVGEEARLISGKANDIARLMRRKSARGSKVTDVARRHTHCACQVLKKLSRPPANSAKHARDSATACRQPRGLILIVRLWKQERKQEPESPKPRVGEVLGNKRSTCRSAKNTSESQSHQHRGRAQARATNRIKIKGHRCRFFFTQG